MDLALRSLFEECRYEASLPMDLAGARRPALTWNLFLGQAYDGTN